jgi:UDP-2-acetamido-2-deoxy-ribo-hexuluronate aminotransferase
MSLSKPILMVDLHGQYLRMKSKIDQAIQEVIDSSSFINGESVKLFARELEEYSGSKHVIPCGNGTEALQIAYMALDLKPGDEVIMPAFNYVAAAEAAVLLGLKPVFIDVWADSFNLNENLLDDFITGNTKAIVAVHLFGQSSNMEGILNIADKQGIDVIEDNAQSLGCEFSFFSGEKFNTGAMGRINTTSFFPTKNLGCFGDGGAIFTNDGALAKRAEMISKHGQGQKYSYELVGCNSRLDTLQAAILRVKLRYLNESVKRRAEAGRLYDKFLSRVEGVVRPARSSFCNHVYNQYVIRVKNRDKVKEELKKAGIPTMIYYPSPLHLQKAYAYLGYKEGDFPASEKLCSEVLALPIHTEITLEQQEYIVDTLSKIVS